MPPPKEEKYWWTAWAESAMRAGGIGVPPPNPGWKGCRECAGALMQDGLVHTTGCSYRGKDDFEALYSHPDAVPAPVEGCPCWRCKDMRAHQAKQVAKKPLSPDLPKNKYHDALLDKVADFAVSVGAPMDIIVELHPDTLAKGYVIRMFRESEQNQQLAKVATFRVGIEDVVQLNRPLIEQRVLEQLHWLTGKVYVKKPAFGGLPIMALPLPAVVQAGPRPDKAPAHGSGCVCAKCEKRPKLKAGPVSADATDPEVPLARRPIDPTKVLDLGDRVMDLE